MLIPYHLPDWFSNAYCFTIDRESNYGYYSKLIELFKIYWRILKFWRSTLQKIFYSHRIEGLKSFYLDKNTWCLTTSWYQISVHSVTTTKKIHQNFQKKMSSLLEMWLNHGKCWKRTLIQLAPPFILSSALWIIEHIAWRCLDANGSYFSHFIWCQHIS